MTDASNRNSSTCQQPAQFKSVQRRVACSWSTKGLHDSVPAVYGGDVMTAVAARVMRENERPNSA